MPATDEFYASLADLRARLQGGRILAECSGRMQWPARGVYFFFEPGEDRGDGTPRVVRIGTHAVSRGSKTSLWTRLRQHRGGKDGSGNHRGSIFRLHVGNALINHPNCPLACPSWADAKRTRSEVKTAEADLEQAVSAYIGAMTVLWVAIPDEPSAQSMRAFVERNAIALLSTQPLGDPPSPGWLGHHSKASEIKVSGLWNVNHVGAEVTPSFFGAFQKLVSACKGSAV